MGLRDDLRVPPRRLWAHQEDAVTGAWAVLEAPGRRATVVAACGTGKTLITAEVARRVTDAAPAAAVLVLVPTIGLLTQTVAEWMAYLGRGVGQVVAVCSEEQSTYGARQAREHLHVQVTTDVEVLRGLYLDASAGRRQLTVFATYASLHAVCAAVGTTRGFDLAVIDEAHRTAGAAGKAWAAVHDDLRLPIARRLYVTATPRILAGGGEETVSMDDEATFGPVVYEMAFSTAIELELLADYQVVVGVVDPARYQIPAPAAGAGAGERGAQLRGAQIALLRAIREHGIRRAVTFHARVSGARWFAETLPAAVRMLPPADRPDHHVAAAWVSGTTPTAQRRDVLARLRDPGEETVVVANARVFGEGIDIPALDCVAFVDPRGSVIDVVQAVGRALRTGGVRGKVATILIPVLVPAGGENSEIAADPAWRAVWEVIRALRAHDDRLAQQLDRPHPLRSGVGADLDWLQVVGDLPAGAAEAINIRILEAATSAWMLSYAAAAAFHTEHGHLRAPSGSAVAYWLAEQRRQYRAGTLAADRIARLDALGIVWSPRQNSWENNLDQAILFHGEHGHLAPPRDHPLYAFLVACRGLYRDGRLAADRAAALEALGISWDPREDGWSTGLAAARAFYAAHGHLRVPAGYPVPGSTVDLRNWVAYYRVRWGEGKLDDPRREALRAIGMAEHAAMPAKQAAWWRTYDELAAHHAEHGSLQFPPGETYSKWLVYQRTRRRAGKLPDDQIAALDTLGMIWEPPRGGPRLGAGAKRSGARP